MDESLQDIEAELKALQPRVPSERLSAQIGRDLADARSATNGGRYVTSTNLNSWKWLGWRTAGIAATLAVAAALGILVPRRHGTPVAADTALMESQAPQRPETGARAARDRYEPVAATNVLYDLKEEGVVTIRPDQPARRVRARYLDTYTWKNPATNASLKWSVPRDEIRVVPASLN